jgi:hypothetical protein
MGLSGRAVALDPWRSIHLAESGDILAEVFADVAAFLLTDGDFDCYSQSFLRLLSRSSYPAPLAITSWVVGDLAKAIDARYPGRQNAGVSLLEFLSRNGDIDPETLLKDPVSETPPPGIDQLRPGTQAAARALLASAWQRAKELGFTEPTFRECLRDTVDYAQTLLLGLHDTSRVGGQAILKQRDAMDRFRALGLSPERAIDPPALEELWRSAIADFARSGSSVGVP